MLSFFLKQTDLRLSLFFLAIAFCGVTTATFIDTEENRLWRNRRNRRMSNQRSARGVRSVSYRTTRKAGA